MTDRRCPCGGSLAGRPRNVTYCLACAVERRRARDRDRGMALRRGLPIPHRCPCGAERPAGRKFCASCRLRRLRESADRYYHSPKGRLNALRYRISPKNKLRRAAYDERHVEQRRAIRARYALKRLKAGTIRPCASTNCGGIFIQAYRGGARKFCDDCRRAFGYTAHDAHRNARATGRPSLRQRRAA